MDVSTTMKKYGLEQAFKYLYKDPEKNLLKLMDWADKFAGEEFGPQRKMVREAMTLGILNKPYSISRSGFHAFI